MINRKSVNEKIAKLQEKGVHIAQKYVQSDLRHNSSAVISIESEISIAELIGKRLAKWDGITLHPRYPYPIDVDIGIQDQGVEFCLQIKTFDIFNSKYMNRMSEAGHDWDRSIPENENAYIARHYRGDELISEFIKPVAGVNKLARLGALHFHPSQDDLRAMRNKILETLKVAQRQLRYIPGIRILVYDVLRSYIDSEILYHTVNDFLQSSVATSNVFIEGIVILTYNFDDQPAGQTILAPIWIAPGVERAMALFRPPHPVHLLRAHPFTIPTHLYHKAGLQNLFTVENDVIKIDGVPYGPMINS